MRLLLCAMALAGATVLQGAAARPNIVLILADDMGYSDIGCYGSEIPTPNIDSLAANGVRFAHFYNTSRCCPTRASLLTGLYPHQAGIGHMTDEYARATREKLGGPGYTTQLNDRCVTIAEPLGAAGYETMMTGKWHVGAERDAWPDRRGFARTFSVIGSGAMNYFGRGIQHIGNTVEMKLELDGKPWEPPSDGFYSTDAFSDQATRFIKERKDPERPFFLYLAYNAPHWPLHALPEDIARHRGKYRAGYGEVRKARLQRQIDLGLATRDTPLQPRDPMVKAWGELTAEQRDEQDLRMAIYAAQVEVMDRGIGRVLAALRENSAEENTLVLFLSDNGGCHEKIERSKPGAELGSRDSYASYGRGWAQVSNTPYPFYKHWTREGGIVTPLVARWPAQLAKAQRSTAIGHLVDLMPTVLAAAGAEYPKVFKDRAVTPMEGINLLPAMKGGRLTRVNPIFWEHEGNRAVREGKWKLVSSFPAEWELYDLEADPTETRNLAAAEPERARAMAAAYDAWAERSFVRPWSLTQPAKK